MARMAACIICRYSILRLIHITNTNRNMVLSERCNHNIRATSTIIYNGITHTAYIHSHCSYDLRKVEKRDANTENIKLEIPNKQLILKFGILAIIYLIIYWLAGYFIAWQNPELRAFYGSPGEITPFFTHTYNTFSNSPSLIILQLARGVLFAAIALPIILASKLKPWQTALLVASLLQFPT